MTVAVVGDPVTDPAIARLLRDAQAISGVQTFLIATRKPMSAGASYQVRAYDVSRGCR